MHAYPAPELFLRYVLVTGGLAVRASYMVKQVVREEPVTALGDKLIESHQVDVLNIDGTTSPGRFDYYESGLLILAMKDLRYGARGDPFGALCDLRLDMEKDGRIPLVNGANRNAYITGMALDMGECFRIYLLGMRTAEGEPLIVDTFGCEHVSDPVFVDSQRAFGAAFFKDEYLSKG